MSTLVVADPSRRGLGRGAGETCLHEPVRAGGGGSTLEQVVSGVWEDLAARALAVCPVRGDEMRAPSAPGQPAVCQGCGSELS